MYVSMYMQELINKVMYVLMLDLAGTGSWG